MAAAFDVKKELQGIQVAGVPVLSMESLQDYVEHKRPDIAILTLPRQFASQVAADLCKWGIQGIWNFTGVDLHLDGLEVPVENVHFSESLMTLSYRI